MLLLLFCFKYFIYLKFLFHFIEFALNVPFWVVFIIYVFVLCSFVLAQFFEISVLLKINLNESNVKMVYIYVRMCVLYAHVFKLLLGRDRDEKPYMQFKIYIN